MRLLIITQAVDQDDPVLGFFYGWIEEFARKVEQVTVVCLREGKHNLPQNVAVYSLGKERGNASRFQYTYRFMSLLWKLHQEYDTVFVHMNPEYVVLAGWLWNLAGRPVGLWYTHKQVDLKLRVATFFSRYVFTASPESFRLASRKVRVTGHGIQVGEIPFKKTNPQEGILKLLTVGRLSPVKRLDLQLEAVALLSKRTGCHFTVIGGALTAQDVRYEDEIKKRAALLGTSTDFMGPVRRDTALQKMAESDIFLHTSETGSLDKVLLEALAAGMKVVSTSNLLPEAPSIARAKPSAEALCEAITAASLAPIVPDVGREYVNTAHGLEKLVEKILKRYGHTTI